MIYELMSYLYTQRYVQYKDEGCVWFQCFFAYNKHLRGFFLNVHASEDPAKFLCVQIFKSIHCVSPDSPDQNKLYLQPNITGKLSPRQKQTKDSKKVAYI